MANRTIVVSLPPGATQVLVQLYDESDMNPAFEEISVRENERALWCPVELTGGGFRVEDEYGKVIRSSFDGPPCEGGAA